MKKFFVIGILLSIYLAIPQTNYAQFYDDDYYVGQSNFKNTPRQLPGQAYIDLYNLHPKKYFAGVPGAAIILAIWGVMFIAGIFGMVILIFLFVYLPNQIIVSALKIKRRFF